MATINFLYRSKRANSFLTLRLLYRYKDNDYTYATKTKVEVSSNYWKKEHDSKTRDASIRKKIDKVNSELNPLRAFILKEFNNIDPLDIDKQWLANQINNYYNPVQAQNESVTYWMQRIIDEAHTRENSKGGVGLSKGRITSYKRLKSLFIEFSKGKNYKVCQMDKPLFKKFKIWLMDEMGFAPTYTFKKLSDLKTVLREAKGENVPTSTDFSEIKTKQQSAYDDDMNVITLSELEIEKIENIKLDSDALVNARKWLILMCYTGQRGETLTKRLNIDSFHHRGKDLTIKIIQKKGNKPVQIPVLPKVKEIYENKLPYSVSTQMLNEHFKTIGKLAELNVEVMGRLEEETTKGKRGVKKMRPKWAYLSTHIGRRTFATMHYEKIPTPIIMRVTGHSKESTFLGYINQSDDTHIDTFLDYYDKKEKKQRKESQLSKVPNASNQ